MHELVARFDLLLAGAERSPTSSHVRLDGVKARELVELIGREAPPELRRAAEDLELVDGVENVVRAGREGLFSGSAVSVDRDELLEAVELLRGTLSLLRQADADTP